MKKMPKALKKIAVNTINAVVALRNKLSGGNVELTDAQKKSI